MNWLKQLIDKVPEKLQSALLFLLVTIILLVVGGLFFGGTIWVVLLLTDVENASFWTCVCGVAIFYFCVFGGFLVVCAVLSIIIPPKKSVYVYGTVLYYGTYALYSVLKETITAAGEDLFLISVVISALICYVIYLRNNKKEE